VEEGGSKGVWIWRLFTKSVSEKKRKKRVRSIGIPLKGISGPVFSGDYFKVSTAELRYFPGFVLYNTSSRTTRSSLLPAHNLQANAR
jgi:hypothetical protein